MNPTPKIYLDYSATTPVDPRVLDAMLPYFSKEFGNPSSTHGFGQRAETAVENAREIISTVLGCSPNEIIFTSGGSESDNLAVRGVAMARRAIEGSNHILTTPVEHKAVAATTLQLAEYFDFDVEYIPVGAEGQIDPMDVRRRLRPDTALVSIIYANNEIGTVAPLQEIGNVCQEQAIPFHSDALQAALSLDLNVESLSVDMLALGAHKFYGPKGVGVLYVRDGIPIQPIQSGGEQELGLRGGTLNVPLIVGMAEALKLAREEVKPFSSLIRPLRDQIISSTLDSIPDSHLTGHSNERLPYHASFIFKGLDGNLLLNMLDSAGFACSSGSACKTGSPAPSEVLLAIGADPGWALGSLRVTLGRWTTDDEVDLFCSTLPQIVEQARKLSAT